MMLPDELEWVLEMLGYRWPTADEDKLRDSAALWREFGEKVNGLHTTANTSARQVLAHNAGESIDKFSKTYEKFDGGGGDGYLQNAAQAAFIIANVMEACAYLVEFAKWAVIAQLIALAIEIVAAHAAAPFTFGLSEVAGLGATQVTRLIVRRLLDELKKALMEAIVEAMKEPAISAIEAIITDLIRQTVNVGFGAQEGYDVSATIKAGGQAGLDALKQTPQTLAEGVRDSLGQKAGNKFHHAVDSRIDGYNGPSSNGLGADGAGGDGGSDTGKSDGDSGSNGSNSSSDSNSSSNSNSNSSSDSGSGSSSDSGSSRSSDSSSDSSSTRSTNDVGSNIGRGISADTGGNDIGGPDVGAGPDSGPGSDSGRDSSSSDSSYPRPTGSSSGPSLSDFDDPSPGGPSSNAGDGNGASNSPSSSGNPSNSGGGSHVSGLSSPTAHSAPTPSSSGGTSSSPGNGAIGTSIDSLAATTPTQSNAAPTTATSDPSPSSSGGRSDGGSAIPSSPVASAAAAGGAGSHHGGSASGGGSPSATSPTPNSGPARNPAAATPSATGTGPASTPSPTAGTGPRSTPATTPTSTPTSDGRGAGAGDGRTGPQRAPGGATPGDGAAAGARSTAGNAAGSTAGNTAGNATPGGDRNAPRNTPGTTPGDRTSPQNTPGDRTAPRNTPGTTATPSDGSTPRNTPGNTTPGDRTTPNNTPGNTTPGDRTSPRNTPDGSGNTRTHTPGQDPRTTTPNQTPSHSNPSQSNPSQSNPSRSNPSQSNPAQPNPSSSTPSRTSPPSTNPNTNTTTPSTSTGTGPDRSSTPNSGTPSNSNPSTPSNRTPNASNPSPPSNHPTQGTPTTPSTPGTPSTPNQPSASPMPNKPAHQPTGNTPNNPQQPATHPDKPENSQQNPDQQQQQQVTPVPIHTVVTTPPPSHTDPTAPQNPGSPQATPNDPGNQHHPNQDSLDDIRADLDHYPGGLTEPDPADQQALADAVPRNDDGTPERFPDPHGPWSQLQNDGGNTVPGRSNNCADCSRSFLETWYGNPQVSAPRTVDTDANGNPDYWSPEDNANDNQIRWTGASHNYAGPGGDPNTANNIASVLQQSGPGSAAIVQVDWPGGGGHAFNVVNHDGNIVWIDTQSGDVSDQPLHLDQAEHVWHIPLDANRNPIDLSQPDATDSNQGTDTAQEGTDTSQDGTDTTQDGSDTSQEGQDTSQQEPDDNSNQSSDDSNPGPETAQQDPQTSEDGPDTTQEKADDSPDTSHSQNQNQDQQTNESDPSPETTNDNPSDNSDATKSESPDTTQSEGPDSAKPTDPEPSQTKDQDSADPENAETSQPKDPDPTQSENPDTTQTGNPDSNPHTDPDSTPPTDPDSNQPSTDPDASEAKDPDAAESTAPDHTTPEDSADGSPQDPSHPDPLPATATRDTTPPGGVTHPTPAEQQSLENSVPRDENGDPTRPPDPADGPWVRNINGDGADSPGRNNNCTDVALSTVDTYAGNPTAAAARTPDPNPDGTPSDRGEKAGRDRIENTLGARFSDMGNGRGAFNRLENTLRNSGHGSQAVIITQDANGRAHAWNAVNHNGRVTYIDAQTGQQSSKPLHNGNNGVFAIPLDSNRQPVTPDNGGQSRPGTTSQPGRETGGTPSGERRAPAEAAGAGDSKDKDKNEEGQKEGKKPKKSKTPEEKAAEIARAKEVAGDPYDSSRAEGTPGYGVDQPGDGSHTHYGMLTDQSQDRLRQTNHVEQVDLAPVVQRLHEWAEPGPDGTPPPLIDAIRASAEGPLSEQRLNELLRPGFEEMSREEKMATVAAIARLSSAFHEAHSVDESGGADLHSRHNPKTGERVDPASLAREYAATQGLLDSGQSPDSAKEMRAEKRKFTSLWNEHVGDKARIEKEEKGKSEEEKEQMREKRRLLRPDFSGKNYAVLEVVETKDDGSTETHYIIDSSVPPNSDDISQDHSEPVLGEAFRARDQANPGRYEAPAMYTEFEPCGDKTHPASANCSDYLVHEMERPEGQERKKYHEKSEEERAVPEGKKNKTTIYYSAGYRMGEMDAAAVEVREGETPEQAAERAHREAKDRRDEDMHRFRGELVRVWMKAAQNSGVG
ncbi:toxin glutamine deamidase domain-containing protein [Streptomyces chartreusis]|nr:toxin glutamine deamidase domain-containing protein [Streptomyces chartreusis]